MNPLSNNPNSVYEIGNNNYQGIDVANKQEVDVEEESKKGHRRSKNDIEGRTYSCQFCGKSYLSYPALYTHCKQKHHKCNTSGRGRGRPKKENADLNSERAKYNPLDVSFFFKETRKGSISNFDEPIKNAFDFLYIQSPETHKLKEEKQMKMYTSIEQHPFLSAFLADVHDVNKKIEKENEISDIVFIDYLNKMSTHVNSNYFVKLITFVTLFREYVNIAKKDDNYSNDYTERTSAEDVPDLSNEFINEFLEPDKSGVFGFPKDEAIDLTQNFCHWMYENNFTCSKLSLINNDK